MSSEQLEVISQKSLTRVLEERPLLAPIPSLKALCVEVLLCESAALEHRASLCRLLRDLADPELKHTVRKLEKELEGKFELLVSRFGEDTTLSILGSYCFERAFAKRRSRLEAERNMASYRRGSAIEPTKVEVVARDDGSFPLYSLISGVKWPESVAPDRRESYLSNDEFEQVFCMTKDQFNALDKVMRVRLKKQHNLF